MIAGYTMLFSCPRKLNVPDGMSCVRKITARSSFGSIQNAVLAAPPQAYSPTEPKALPEGDKKIGLTEEFRVDVGTVVHYDPSRTLGGTPGGGKLNRALKAYGYRAESEGKDGDHVVETQIGGPNELFNLWPLQASENRSSGSLLARGVREAKEKIRASGADSPNSASFYLRIKSTLPDNP